MDEFVNLMKIFSTKSLKEKFLLKDLVTLNHESLQKKINNINVDKARKDKFYNLIRQYCKIFDEEFDENFDYLNLNNPTNKVIIIMLLMEVYPIAKFVVLNIFLQEFKFNSV